MHDWQHTGHRKKMMAQGTAEYSARYGKKETKLHYCLLCTDQELKMGRNQQLRMLQQQLKSINTYPGITTMIGKSSQ